MQRAVQERPESRRPHKQKAPQEQHPVPPEDETQGRTQTRPEASRAGEGAARAKLRQRHPTEPSQDPPLQKGFKKEI